MLTVKELKVVLDRLVKDNKGDNVIAISTVNEEGKVYIDTVSGIVSGGNKSIICIVGQKETDLKISKNTIYGCMACIGASSAEVEYEEHEQTISCPDTLKESLKMNDGNNMLLISTGISATDIDTSHIFCKDKFGFTGYKCYVLDDTIYVDVINMKGLPNIPSHMTIKYRTRKN